MFSARAVLRLPFLRCLSFTQFPFEIISRVCDSQDWGALTVKQEAPAAAAEKEGDKAEAVPPAEGEASGVARAPAVTDFLDVLDRFVAALATAQQNSERQVKLHDAVPLSNMSTESGTGQTSPQVQAAIETLAAKTPAELQTLASNTELLERVEQLVDSWAKQIQQVGSVQCSDRGSRERFAEPLSLNVRDVQMVTRMYCAVLHCAVQVLAESEQIRRESDDIGPAAELAYWRARMSKFNSLMEQMKSARVTNALLVLQTAKSRLVRHWKTLVRPIRPILSLTSRRLTEDVVRADEQSY